MTRLGVAALAAAAIVTLTDPGGASQTPSAEEFAQGQYRLALEFLRQRKYSEALRDLQRVIDAYPNTSVADDALLELVRFQLDVARDLDAAEKTVTLLLQKYPATDVTPLAYVMAGRIAMTGGTTPEAVDAALANFERAGVVPRLDVAPIASFYAGEALAVGNRHAEAVDRYMRVVLEYPRSPWAARALLALARTWTALRDPGRAMAALQRLRDRFPGTPEAEAALAGNTVLYRLYLRAPAAPPFAFTGTSLAGSSGKLEDVQALAPGPDGHVFVAARQTVFEFDAEGAVVRTLGGTGARGVFVDPEGAPVVVLRNGWVAPPAAPVLLTASKPDGSPRNIDDVRAAVLAPTGHVVVAEGGGRGLTQFRMDGKMIGEFGAVRAERLAVDALGEVAALDRESKSVARVDRAGRVVSRLPTRGAGYELRNPVDLAFDPLRHLYVLDRDAATVFVFATDNTLVTTFTLPERAPGAFRRATAMAVDRVGRLFIYDARAERVQLYR